MKHSISRRSAVALLMGAPFLRPAPTKAQQMDFSDITSRDRAEQLAAEGRLVRILLFPAEFGGEDVPPNVTFVPPAAVPIRAQLLGTLTRFIEQGLIDRMTVHPEYQGNSFVPVRLRFNATHSTRGRSFEPIIQIWPVASITEPPQ